MTVHLTTSLPPSGNLCQGLGLSCPPTTVREPLLHLLHRDTSGRGENLSSLIAGVGVLSVSIEPGCHDTGGEHWEGGTPRLGLTRGVAV